MADKNKKHDSESRVEDEIIKLFGVFYAFFSAVFGVFSKETSVSNLPNVTHGMTDNRLVILKIN